MKLTGVLQHFFGLRVPTCEVTRGPCVGNVIPPCVTIQNFDQNSQSLFKHAQGNNKESKREGD